MKKLFASSLFFMIMSSLFPQTGTIKIVKAKPKIDTIIPWPKTRIVIIVHAGTNYTFKKNNKIGYQGGIAFGPGYKGVPYPHIYSIGLEYCVEEQNYHLSSWHKDLQAPVHFIANSGTRAEYLQVPFRVGSHLITGRASNLHMAFGLTPEYLLKIKNADQRLSYSDFRQYNLSGSVTLGMYFKRVYRIELTYAKDFFENLKDKNIYDSSGTITGKQKSKTNLVSLTISYGI